jgi:hypothetical protein
MGRSQRKVWKSGYLVRSGKSSASAEGASSTGGAAASLLGSADVQAQAGRQEVFDFKTLHIIQHLLATGDADDVQALKDLDVL